MNKLTGILLFILGAGIGSGATYYILRDRFEEEQAEREAQIKSAYDAKYLKEEDETAKENVEPSINISLKESMMANKKDITDYANIAKREGYIEKKEEKNMIDGEVIIEPDNYDGLVGFAEPPFDVVFATIYADGYLVDSNDNIIDIDEQIGGRETLEHFGEGDDPELLHVRNNLYEIDYEIDKDDRTYAEVSGKDPADLPPID